MSVDFRYFPRIIEEVVSSVRAEYDVNNVLPYFEFGTYLELIKRNKIKESNSTNNTISPKYPLIWLVWEANENQKTWVDDAQYNVSPRIFICVGSNSDYSSDERYTASFENILHPIKLELIAQMKYHVNLGIKNIDSPNEIEHLLWGESLGFQKNQNVLNDVTDSLELKFNNLEVNKKC